MSLIKYIKAGTLGAQLGPWFKVSSTTLLDRIGSTVQRSRLNENFDSVQTYCLFIGYPRSGHSLIGSIIDAHPNAIASHRLDSIKFFQAGFNKQQLAYMIFKNSERFSKNGRVLTGNYKYEVPGQFNGRFSKLLVMSDQEGTRTAERLSAEPGLIEKLQKLSGVNLKFVHVIRNPFDNITTMAIRTNLDLHANIERYFSLSAAVENVKKHVPADKVLDIRHEDVIDRAFEGAQTLCGFLDLETDDAFANDCASIVYKSPNKTRNKLAWSQDLIDDVQRRMEKYPWYDGYTFDS